MKLLVMSSKFEDSQRLIIQLSAAEDDRIHELRKISQERDKAWQSELTALQNQQSIGMAAWCSATKEIQKLKSQIEILKGELIKKDSVIESLKIQIAETKDGNELVKSKLTIESGQTESEVESELKEAKAEIAVLKSKLVVMDVDLRTVLDMNKKLNEEIRAMVSLEDVELGSEIIQSTMDDSELTSESSEIESELKEAKAEIVDLKLKLANMEVDLRTVLDMNKKLNDETSSNVNEEDGEFSSTTILSAVDASELTFESSQIESELKEAKSEIADLKSKLLNMDADLRTVLDMNQKLNDEIRASARQQDVEFSSIALKSAADGSELTFQSNQLESELKEAKSEIADLKSKLANKDVDLRSILDMNKKLNNEIRAQVNQVDAEFSSTITRAAVDISELKGKITDKDAALRPMEEELRRVKAHSNQWRKAAETAAAILMEGTEGRVIEAAGSADPGYLCDRRALMNSPSLDERGCESPGTKNHNVLRMIAGLWKKM
ncbi:hypothetical protein KSP40_PGU019874 [Platanthera guangdongensis]|uniref:Uncharacterized protein n=1 Tax=Platanthera guangdongensis TaxID=2320717 RepID=A0ABR2M0K5_9ASPA